MSARLMDTRRTRSRQLQDNAAIYAYREQLKVADKKQQDAVKRDTVASSLNLPTHSRRTNTPRSSSERPPMTCMR